MSHASHRGAVLAQVEEQVTIPGEFRDVLGIEADTLLSISLVGDHMEVTPLRQTRKRCGATPTRTSSASWQRMGWMRRLLAGSRAC